MQTELVIFDCDGVLVESETLGNRILVEFVAEFGLILKLEEAILLFKGCKMADCLAVIEQRLGKKMPQDFVTQLRTRTAKAFEDELLPVQGIEAALDKINLPICVASSGPIEKIKLALRVTNLLPQFEGYFVATEWRVSNTVEELLSFLKARAYGLCWRVSDDIFHQVINEFEEFCINHYGSLKTNVSSEAKFEIWVYKAI
ncbi:HAD hydrolase-like protein [Nostoc sp. LEGE 12450]|uniref:HAD hydrolase-like protein n=1 Tax=Nostoc sp. LEGE 12450 TaxID=1828643 RepID=UPI001880FBD5|nr:HAD hydrolase-like protein [Nostoc sp. LEGE 12450]MBE8991154.1 HAD hydrolase-like protein [Nostoc sp. LEGE 12450]